jgi:hypothetical protein
MAGADEAEELEDDTDEDENGWGVPKKPDFNKIDYDNYDLNKLGTEELKLHKSNMDKAFKKNQKNPTAADFEYDVRAEFSGAKEANEWDDDDDNEDDYFEDDFV